MSPRHHRSRHPKARKSPRKAAPIKVAVILPCAPAAKPVVTWQTKGRRVLITIRDFLIG